MADQKSNLKEHYFDEKTHALNLIESIRCEKDVLKWRKQHLLGKLVN